MNELMFTGLQMVGSSVMCLAAGIGIGAIGWELFSVIAGRVQRRKEGVV